MPMSMLTQLMQLNDLDLPPLTELDDLDDRILRFFDDDEHVMGDDCPCLPHVEGSPRSRSGLILVHNKYNLVPRSSLCFLQE